MLRHRDDIISFLSENCPSIIIRNLAAAHDGQFLNLGAFRPVPGSNAPGWVCRFTSEARQQYYVAIACHEVPTLALTCFIPDHIDWKSYVGGATKLYAGDMPERAKIFQATKRFDNLIGDM